MIKNLVMKDKETTTLIGKVDSVDSATVVVTLGYPASDKLAHIRKEDMPEKILVPLSEVMDEVIEGDSTIEVRHRWIKQQPWFFFREGNSPKNGTVPKTEPSQKGDSLAGLVEVAAKQVRDYALQVAGNKEFARIILKKAAGK